MDYAIIATRRTHVVGIYNFQQLLKRFKEYFFLWFRVYMPTSELKTQGKKFFFSKLFVDSISCKNSNVGKYIEIIAPQALTPLSRAIYIFSLRIDDLRY